MSFNSCKIAYVQAAIFTISALASVVASSSSTIKPIALWLTESEPNFGGNEKLFKYITRVGPNMRASADYHDYTDVHLNESLVAWRLMHQQVQEFAHQKVYELRPQLIKLLQDSNVSLSCQYSAKLTLDSLENLDSWALRSKSLS